MGEDQVNDLKVAGDYSRILTRSVPHIVVVLLHVAAVGGWPLQCLLEVANATPL